MMQIISHPVVIAALIAGIISLVNVGWSHYREKKMSNSNELIKNQKEILKQLNGKKDSVECKADMDGLETAVAGKRAAVDCVDFRTRIGRESQDHYNSNRKVERALSFLVTKAGGTPADLDLG